jgi:hypothetical protein
VGVAVGGGSVGVCVRVGGMGVKDGVNVRVGVTGVAEGVKVKVEGRNGVDEGRSVAEGGGVTEALGVGVNVSVAVSKLGVVDGPAAVGIISVRVGEAVKVGVGVGVLGPGAN